MRKNLIVRYFKNHISRFIAFIIAMQILNMSIDAPSAQMQPGDPAALNFNYIDTYVEFIAEVILKYDNAIPESKDRQQKEVQQHKQFEKTIEQKICLADQIVWLKNTAIPRPRLSDRYAYQFVKEINPPPPKA